MYFLTDKLTVGTKPAEGCSELKKETIALLKAIAKYMKLKGINNYTNEDGEKYRYLDYRMTIPHIPYYMEIAWNIATKANGREHDVQFNNGGYSFYFERQKTINQLNGRISFSKLEII